MYLLIENDDLLEKYNTIWDKVSADMKKDFDSEPVYNKKFLETRIKSHGDEVTDFYDKEIPKVDFNHTLMKLLSASDFKRVQIHIRHIINGLERLLLVILMILRMNKLKL